MYKLVVDRLMQFGYVANSEDDNMIKFQIEKTTNYAKISCNIQELPKELIPITVDVICAEILFDKFSTGQLKDDFDFDSVAKSIKVGDTQVQYELGSITPTSAFLSAMKTMKQSYDRTLSYFRKVKW